MPKVVAEVAEVPEAHLYIGTVIQGALFIGNRNCLGLFGVSAE